MRLHACATYKRIRGRIRGGGKPAISGGDYEDISGLIEIECWRLGIDEARKNGILFTDNAINWGYKTALSYTGHDARECLNWKNKYGKKLFVNKIRVNIG